MEYVEWPGRKHGLARDRVLFLWTAAWQDWCDANMDAASAGISAHCPWGTATAEEGWRERRPFFAVQVIRHCILGDLESAYGEADVDAGNPAMGLAPAILHGCEWLWHRVPRLIGGRKKFTGPFLVAREFRRRGWKVKDLRVRQG